jgi:AmiR/NasT family two-component response regulator
MVGPRLRTALAARVVIEQAKGFLRERLDVSVEDAFTLLRRYARSNHDHLTEVSRRLIAQPDSRAAMLAAMTTLKAAPSA